MNTWVKASLCAVTFALLTSATATYAQESDAPPANDPRPEAPADPIAGTWKIVGVESNAVVSGSATISKQADGSYAVVRTTKRSNRRWRNLAASTLELTGKLEGSTLSLTLVSGPEEEGASDRIEDLTRMRNRDLDGAQLVIKGSLALSNENKKLRGRLQRIVNDTDTVTWRTTKETWTRSAEDAPADEDPSEDDSLVERLPLGSSVVTAANTVYKVRCPTEGSLTVTADAGAVTVSYPDKDTVVSGGDGQVASHDVAKDKLGYYYVQVLGDAGANLRCRFVQDGQIAKEIRPWGSHTYYPIYEKNNKVALFREDGPLDKLDKALGLEDDASIRKWELGSDTRRGFGFEDGHITGVSRPSEKHAEVEWKADLNGNGVIDEGGEASLKKMDRDGDGKVSREEAVDNALVGYFNNYDDNSDGEVTKDEINETFIARYDSNSDSKLDEAEWIAALRKDYLERLNIEDKVNELFENDADSDNFIVADEIDDLGAIDFMDSSDVDGDKENFFDRDNVMVITKDDEKIFGNRFEEKDGELIIYKGRKKDEEAGRVKLEDVKERKTGIADGDLDDSYSVGWWGHCNAWAMAAIIFKAPEETLTKGDVELSVRDQKGLLVEMGMKNTEDSTFWWQQWGNGDDIPNKKYTADFHAHIKRWLRVEQQGLMVDLDAKNPANSLNFQVWNYPVAGYEAELSEAEGGDDLVLDVSCRLLHANYADEFSESSKTVKYRLHFDEAGTIRSDDEAKTDWNPGREQLQKKYLRYLIHPFRFRGNGSSGNPKLTMETLEQLFGDKLKFNDLGN